MRLSYTNLRSSGLVFGPSRSPRPTPQSPKCSNLTRHIFGAFNATSNSTAPPIIGRPHPPPTPPSRTSKARFFLYCILSNSQVVRIRTLGRSKKKHNYTPYSPACRLAHTAQTYFLTVDHPNPPQTDPLVAPLWALNYSSPGFISNHRVCHGDECGLWFNRILNKPSEANHLTTSMRGSNSN